MKSINIKVLITLCLLVFTGGIMNAQEIIKDTVVTVAKKQPNQRQKIDGVIATVKRIILKDKTAKRIATITVNKSFLSIPAKGKHVLKDLIVEIPILENISNWQSLSQIRSVNDIQTETILGVLGKEYSIIK